MAFDKLVGKAKDKAKNVADKAKDVTEQAKHLAQESSEKAKTKAQEATDMAKEVSEKAKDVTVEASGKISTASHDAAQKFQVTAGVVVDWSKEKIQGTIGVIMAEFNALKPILKEAGFLVKRVEVGLSIPPEVNVFLGHRGSDPSALDQVLVTYKDTLTKFQYAVLISLKKTFDINQVTIQYGYTLGDFEVTLSVPPQVKVELIESGAPVVPQIEPGEVSV